MINVQQAELFLDKDLGQLVRRRHFPKALGVDPVVARKLKRTDARFPPRVRANAFVVDVQLKTYRDILRKEWQL